MICPVQRSWEAVRVASMLDILARLKTTTFGSRTLCKRLHDNEEFYYLYKLWTNTLFKYLWRIKKETWNMFNNTTVSRLCHLPVTLVNACICFHGRYSQRGRIYSRWKNEKNEVRQRYIRVTLVWEKGTRIIHRVEIIDLFAKFRMTCQRY